MTTRIEEITDRICRIHMLPLRLVAVAADGSERTLGEYTLAHTAYVPPS